jgi:hypothetical protein
MDNTNPLLEEVLGDRVLNSQVDEQLRFYVLLEVGGIRYEWGWGYHGAAERVGRERERERERGERFKDLLQLLQIGLAPIHYRWGDEELAVDFSKSILLTSNAYITMMREKM